MARHRAWTDEQLSAAVAGSATLAEVLARLGLAKGGASLGVVRRRMLQLGLDRTDLLRRASSARWAADPDDDAAHAPIRGRWTDEELRMAVATSTSMQQVLGRLGYRGSGQAWSAAKARVLQLELDISHFGSHPRVTEIVTVVPRKSARRSWTDHQLREAVRASTSMLGVHRCLGLRPGGSTYLQIGRRIADLGLDISHFKGQGWSRGLKVTLRPARPLAELLVSDSDYLNTSDLKHRLFKEGLKNRQCESCGRRTWQDLPMPLQLDHVNGVRSDNRLENLRILCPNCHAQTETWCGRNIGRSARSASMASRAPMVEMADTTDSKSVAERREGSSPSRGTQSSKGHSEAASSCSVPLALFGSEVGAAAQQT